MLNLLEFRNPAVMRFGEGSFERCILSLKESDGKKILVIADPFLRGSERLRRLEE